MKKVWLAAAGLFLFWTAIGMLRYQSFDFFDWDLALAANDLWLLSHGETLSPLRQMPVWGAHAHGIAFLLAPLYRLLPSPLLLLGLKGLAAGLTLPLLVRITQEQLGDRRLTICIAIGFFLYPAFSHALFHEFNYEALAALPLLAMIGGLLSGRFRWFLLGSAGALLLKENLALAVLLLGGAGSWLHRGRGGAWRWGVVGAAAAGWLALYLAWIAPGARGTAEAVHWSYYGRLGGTPPEVLAGLLNPAATWAALQKPGVPFWLWQLFAPTGGLVLFGIPGLLPAIPFLLIQLHADTIRMQSIYFHYGAVWTPFVFLAVILGVKTLQSRLRDSIQAGRLIGSWLLFCALLTQISWGPLARLAADPNHLIPDASDRRRAGWIAQIPSEASVYGSHRYLSHLTNRPRLYGPHAQAEIPADAAYMLLDLEDPIAPTRMDPELETADALATYLDQQGWELLGRTATEFFLRRKDS